MQRFSETIGTIAVVMKVPEFSSSTMTEPVASASG
jgi:hypothetical protein